YVSVFLAAVPLPPGLDPWGRPGVGRQFTPGPYADLDCGRNAGGGAADWRRERCARRRPSQGFYSRASASLLRDDLGVLRGSAVKAHLSTTEALIMEKEKWSGRADLNRAGRARVRPSQSAHSRPSPSPLRDDLGVLPG